MQSSLSDCLVFDREYLTERGDHMLAGGKEEVGGPMTTIPQGVRINNTSPHLTKIRIISTHLLIHPPSNRLQTLFANPCITLPQDTPQNASTCPCSRRAGSNRLSRHPRHDDEWLRGAQGCLVHRFWRLPRRREPWMPQPRCAQHPILLYGLDQQTTLL